MNIFKSISLLVLITISTIIYLSTDVNFRLNREIKPVKKMSGAYEALNFWTRMRAYPNKDIPPMKYFNEFKRIKKISQSNRISQITNDTWEAMGPTNVPGRMISLAVNPQNSNTLYAGSASGGLWRTFDATTGSGWHRIETGFPVLGVMAIAIDPSDSNLIYIGTGEVYGYKKSIGGTVVRTTRGSYGIGILKSTDGGRTWSKSLDWTQNQERGIEDLEINPLNSNTIYAATSEGIYKSVNAGISWVNILPVLMGEDIVINLQDTNKVMVSCGNLGSLNAGIYRSFDAGANWNILTGIPSFSGKTLIDNYLTNSDIVFASVADSLSGIGLYKTTDFGNTWNLVNNQDVPRYQGFFAHWVAVHPTDINQIVYAGVDIYKSTNGGSNLNINYTPHVDHHNFAHDPNNPNYLYISCDGGVYRSTDFGSTYKNIGIGLQTAQFYNGFSSSYQDSNFAIGGLQDNNTVIYNGSFSWTRVIGGDGCWTAINPSDDNTVYGEYQYNNIQKSKNRGLSFSSATNGMTDNAAFVAPYVLAPSNPSVLYSGRRIVYKTVDESGNWFGTNNDSPLDGNFVLSMAVSPQNENIVFAGTAPTVTRAHIFMTINGGNNWNNVTANLPDRYPNDIAVDPKNESTAYVVFGGFGSGHVYKTTNSGASWNNITGNLPDVPTLSVTIDPLNSDYIYVGNDIGIYFSTDGGTTWNDFSDGLPDAVIAMELNISTINRKLRVATHGNGVFERSLLYSPSFLISFSPFAISPNILLGSELNFGGTVSNIGNEAQTDTIKIEVLVLNSDSSIVFSEIKEFCCLGSKQSMELNFDQTYIPASTGGYTIEYIMYGNTQQPDDQFYNQQVNIINAPSITQSVVSKIYKPYEEISNTTILPKGDDIQSKFNLPFQFNYDGYLYNKMQVSTNGWAEFGTGQDGTERGLSTSSQIGQIGANENGRLASTRPNKTLGPWWEDLNTDLSGITGTVSYKTLGNEPDRVFVIQWKNMRAYYDASSTTARVNFQIRLYENTSKFEFCYGPVQQGTFAGPDIGAMIGFKDHIGGDYHFYDIAAGGPGLTSTLVTDLSPLTDWPGPDSAFVIETIITDVKNEETKIPSNFTLYQNYPNPFNPTTTIKYTIPLNVKGQTSNGSLVQLSIFDVLGREVTTLVNKNQKPGNYKVEFNASNFSSGVYYYRLKAGYFTRTKKMIVLK